MLLFNSLTNQLEPVDLGRDQISLYVCGITPYDTTHLGHAFTYVSADILVRFLEHCGQRVRYVQNVTDIDDDILRVAAEQGQDWRRLGNYWTRHYIQDMISLNVRPPEAFPRATDVIPEIIATVQALLDAGVAYQVGGSVYYSIAAWPSYGELSRLPRQEMLPVANERGNNPGDPNKRDPLDFVLWQARSGDEPSWPSPWGLGRPGWHIECSTMATEFLGGTIDIHAGGMDLIFPHHESEIAQTQPLLGAPPVRHWMHVAMLELDGEKMSKSLGNLIMVRDLLKSWSADALRLYLASNHYRSRWGFQGDGLARAQEWADMIAEAAAGQAAAAAQPAEDLQAFRNALKQDLDTPTGVRMMVELARALTQGKRANGEAAAALRAMGEVMGLRMGAGQPEEAVRAGWSAHLHRFADAGADTEQAAGRGQDLTGR